MKMLTFARRNAREILRDPLSFVFCLAMPVLLLVLFRVIQYNVGDSWMPMADLVPGVSFFSTTFVMLFMTLLVSKDRQTAFLARLRNAPLTGADFVGGYALPGVCLGLLQTLITNVTGVILAVIPNGKLTLTGASVVSFSYDQTVFPPVKTVTETVFPFGGIFLSVLATLPVILFFVFLGIFFGCLLSERSAPGISSAVITGGGVLGGAWMPLATMGGFETFCKCLPFYPAVIVARETFLLRAVSVPALLTVLGYAVLTFFLAVFAFRRTTG